ncbi:TetR/AcrR family transcriptional regulator [Actinoallomurus iriomotensis]|uniref:TetR family transcriptional regulator n=1 Tax=Actinoallomurus iriomotensis TaxID=478107 RepID=A0A9W6VW69_9ACTN|nr:TetR/AcrR family transcriptional regulator [Actinoallomurus iriomotensis]GLY82550.1 TetR family transcriptional regulator [Actinoallomurus iriomotensis]
MAQGTAEVPGRARPLPERLLEAATRLFAGNGYENTSVQEIVAAAGVTKGAMYHYFAAKDDLLYEIYHRLLALQTERLERIAGGPGTPEERLRDAVLDVIETSCAHLDELTVFFRSMHLLPEDKRRAVRAERRRYHERFRALVEEGRRDGTFRTDAPADLAVNFLFGAVHQISTWWHPDGALGPRDVGRHYVALFLDGLRRAGDTGVWPPSGAAL